MRGQSSAPGTKASLNLPGAPQLKNGFRPGIVRDCAKAGMTVDDQADSEVGVMEQVNIEAAGTSLCTFWKLSRCCYIIF